MKTKKADEVKIPNWIIIITILVIVLWLVSAIIIYYLFPDWSVRGTFGDMFGAINSLFSGLAFLGVIITVYLQKKELEYQRLEIIQTRIELEKSATAQQNSEKALQSQVESTLIAAKINALKYLIEDSSFGTMNTSKAYFRKEELLRELNSAMNLLNRKLKETPNR